ncbi:separin protein [Tieghemiomyces parasiticus]|uniref:separase n=1 Tax=Tieghemiomyces parasiticus TaxID=78921 RepID=A0A9W7ZWD8_9FUNG|nr:separin protein [Tieghemiomyces parasiticus]
MGQLVLPTDIASLGPSFEATLVATLTATRPSGGRTTTATSKKTGDVATPSKADLASRAYYAMKLVNLILSKWPSAKAQPSEPGLDVVTVTGCVDHCLRFLRVHEALVKLRPYDLAKVESNYISKLIQLGQYDLAFQQLNHYRKQYLLAEVKEAVQTKSSAKTRPPTARPRSGAAKAPLTASNRTTTAPAPAAAAKGPDSAASSSLIHLPLTYYATDETYNLLVVTSFTHALRCALESRDLTRLRSWVPHLRDRSGTCHGWCLNLRQTNPSIASTHLEAYFRVLHRTAALFPTADAAFLVYKRESLAAYAQTRDASVTQLADLVLHAALTVEKAGQKSSLADAAALHDMVFDGILPPLTVQSVVCLGPYKLLEHQILLNRKLKSPPTSLLSFRLWDQFIESVQGADPLLAALSSSLVALYRLVWMITSPGLLPHPDRHEVTKALKSLDLTLLPALSSRSLTQARDFLTVHLRAVDFLRKALISASSGSSDSDRTSGDASHDQLPWLVQPNGALDTAVDHLALVATLYHRCHKAQPDSSQFDRYVPSAVACLHAAARYLFNANQPTTFHRCRASLQGSLRMASTWPCPASLALTSSTLFNYGGSLYRARQHTLATIAFQDACTAAQNLLVSSPALPPPAVEIDLCYDNGVVKVTNDQLCKRYEFLGVCQLATSRLADAVRSFARALMYLPLSRRREVVAYWQSEPGAPPELASCAAYPLVERYVKAAVGLTDLGPYPALGSIWREVGVPDHLDSILVQPALMETELALLRRYAAKSATEPSQALVLAELARHYAWETSPAAHVRLVLEEVRLQWTLDPHTPTEDLVAEIETLLDQLKERLVQSGCTSLDHQLPQLLAHAYSWLAILQPQGRMSRVDRDVAGSTALEIWRRLLSHLSDWIPRKPPAKRAETSQGISQPDQLAAHLAFLTDQFAADGSLTNQIAVMGLRLRLLHLYSSADTPIAEATKLYTQLGLAHLRLGHDGRALEAITRALTLCETMASPNEDVLSTHLAYVRCLVTTGQLAKAESAFQTATAVSHTILNSKLYPGRPSDPTRPRKVSPRKLDVVILAQAALVYAELCFNNGDWATAALEGTRAFRLLSYALSSLARRRQARRQTLPVPTRDPARTLFGPDDDDEEGTTSPTTTTTTSAQPSSLTAQFERTKLEEKYALLHDTNHWQLQTLFFDTLWFLGRTYCLKGHPKETDYFLKQAAGLAETTGAVFNVSVTSGYRIGFLARQHEWEQGRPLVDDLWSSFPTTTKATGPLYAVTIGMQLATWFDRQALPEQAQEVYGLASKLLARTGELGAEETSLEQEITPRTVRVVQYLTDATVPVTTDEVVPPSNTLLDHLRSEIALQLAYRSPRGSEALDGDSTTVTAATLHSCQPRAEFHLRHAKALLQRTEHTKLGLEARTEWATCAAFFTIGAKPMHSKSKATAINPMATAATTEARTATLLAALDHLQTAYADGLGALHPHDLFEVCMLVGRVYHLLVRTDPVRLRTDAAGYAKLTYYLEMAKGIVARREMLTSLQRKLIGVVPNELAWPAKFTIDCGNPLAATVVVGHETDEGATGLPSPTLRSRTLTSIAPGSPNQSEDDDLFTVASTAPTPTSISSLSSTALDLRIPSGTDDAVSRHHRELYVRYAEASIATADLPAEISSAFLDHLPPSWVVCGLSIDPDAQLLYLTRYVSPVGATHPSPPLVIQLDLAARPDFITYQAVTTTFQAIILRNNDTSASGKYCVSKEDKVQWWRSRMALDEQLRNLLADIQARWLGPFVGLLRDTRHTRADDLDKFKGGLQKLVASQAKGRVLTRVRQLELGEMPACFLAAHAAGDLDEGAYVELWRFIVDMYATHGIPISFDDTAVAQATAELRELLETCQSSELPDTAQQPAPHVVLVVDKYAQSLPWESIPCLRHRSVSRVPSVHFLRDRLAWMRHRAELTVNPTDAIAEALTELTITAKPATRRGRKPRSTPLALADDNAAAAAIATNQSRLRVRRSRVYYVLNPGRDLLNTQREFEPALRAQSSWDGAIGRAPLDKECEQALQTRDIYIYFGHSGGEQYLRGQRVRALPRCAVSLLFGCSSGHLKAAGEFDPYGTALDYMVGGCPSLVANLWDVTDKDIDRFSKSLMAKWGLLGEVETGSSVSLTEAVRDARDDCNLKYLIGAAPVVYGIPCYLEP